MLDVLCHARVALQVISHDPLDPPRLPRLAHPQLWQCDSVKLKLKLLLDEIKKCYIIS